MKEVCIKQIQSRKELDCVLELCYRVLGQTNQELYGVDAWVKRLEDGKQPLVYAEQNGQAVAAVLGRAESEESLIIGFVACHEDYRGQGITRALMEEFEKKARAQGFQYITLGSRADAFYEKCGYKVIFQTHGQNIYQKMLG